MKLSVLSLFVLGCVALVSAQAPAPYTGKCLNYRVLPAQCDTSVCNTEGGHVLYLFSGAITDDTQYVFQFATGSLSQAGEALVLQGTLVPFSDRFNTQDSFLLHLVFLPETDTTGLGMVEVTDPSRVDQSSWAYFSLYSADSYMIGLENNAGLIINVTQQDMMMPLQLGTGANGKNLAVGAAVWVTLTTPDGRTVSGDINVNLDCTEYVGGPVVAGTSGDLNPSGAASGSTNNNSGDNANSNNNSNNNSGNDNDNSNASDNTNNNSADNTNSNDVDNVGSNDSGIEQGSSASTVAVSFALVALAAVLAL